MTATKAPGSWDRLGSEQLRIYARELVELYQRERQSRQVAEEKNQALEQKIRELTALNSMFQEHLRLRLEVEEACEKLTAGIRRLADEADGVLGQRKTNERQPGPAAEKTWGSQ